MKDAFMFGLLVMFAALLAAPEQTARAAGHTVAVFRHAAGLGW